MPPEKANVEAFLNWFFLPFRPQIITVHLLEEIWTGFSRLQFFVVSYKTTFTVQWEKSGNPRSCKWNIFKDILWYYQIVSWKSNKGTTSTFSVGHCLPTDSRRSKKQEQENCLWKITSFFHLVWTMAYYIFKNTWNV